MVMILLKGNSVVFTIDSDIGNDGGNESWLCDDTGINKKYL